MLERIRKKCKELTTDQQHLQHHPEFLCQFGHLYFDGHGLFPAYFFCNQSAHVLVATVLDSEVLMGRNSSVTCRVSSSFSFSSQSVRYLYFYRKYNKSRDVTVTKRNQGIENEQHRKLNNKEGNKFLQGKGF